jgi:rhamnosyltransferase subunit B
VKRVVLATFGSLGDLHPFLAIAMGLRERGFQPVLATHELYRARIESLGIEFAALRPDYDPSRQDLNLLSMDPWKGTETILRESLFPHLRETYEDLERAVAGASLLLSHLIVFPAPLVAEKTGMRWATGTLAPIAMMSVTDPPHAAPIPWVNKMWSFGSLVNRGLMGLLRAQTLKWCEPVAELRREVGLAKGPHPLFEGQHSSFLALALFSRILGSPQPDWPKGMKQTGFCFLDDATEMPEDLRQFLEEGEAPVVFTLGSAAVLTAGDFFVESVRALERLGGRAVFVAGKESRIASSKDVFVTAYAPYSQVFGRASVIVHQGGVGTTGQGLRAGRPALIVPFAHDQPDNAARVVREGIGRSIPRANYTAQHAAEALRALMRNGAYSQRAGEAARIVAEEDGVDAACQAISEAVSG